MPALAVPTAEYFLTPLRRTLDYAERLVKDIPAERFAEMPHPTMNHPAFCIGHLSLYPNRCFTMIDRKDLVREKPGYSELFAAGAECQPGDQCSYPPKDEIWSYYREGHERVIEVLADLPDEVFERPNPMEGRMREIFPIVGVGVNFLLNNHHMMHLGQISAWRRAIGMGPA